MAISGQRLEYLQQLEIDWQLRNAEGDQSEEFWGWSPLDFQTFNQMLALAARRVPQGSHFLELGSGIGTKLILAKEGYGLRVSGIELRDDYASVARVLGLSYPEIRIGDLRTIDIAWEAYDIVYNSRPFRGEAEEERWEQRIIDSIRPGAIYIAAFASVKPYSWECLTRAPWRGVWVKPGQADASTGHAPPLSATETADYR
jgi:hypothetical protein